MKKKNLKFKKEKVTSLKNSELKNVKGGEASYFCHSTIGPVCTANTSFCGPATQPGPDTGGCSHATEATCQP